MRFGVAITDISPPFRVPMCGYGYRKDSFDGVHDPLTFTALVLEEGDRRALIGAVDLVCMHRDGSIHGFLEELGKIVGCPPDNVMLNASHTHGGPHVPTSERSYRHMSDPESVKRYGKYLYETMAEAVRGACENLQEGTLWFGEGTTSLPISRRLERDGKIHHAPSPDGPTDNRMHILAFRNAEERLAVVGMKISCHSVATGARHLLTADYPGAWRAEFSRAFGPEVTPFFLQGAGADTRPRHTVEGDHWRAIPHCELAGIGRELLAEGLVVLTSQRLEPVENLVLAGKIQPVEVPCERTYTEREQFQELLDSENEREKRYAEECLRRLDAGEEVPDHATFHVQTLWLNSELALIGLDVEPLCGLGHVVESAVAPKRAILLGYTNGSFAYVPTTEEMARGGYEAESFYGKPWTGVLAPGMEDRFAEAVTLL